MCTSIYYPFLDKQAFFGRTMDFSYPIECNLYVVSKGYTWYSVNPQYMFENKYKFMGVGQLEDEIFVFFDGVNQQGLAAAALYFPGYAYYPSLDTSSDKIPIASYNFLNYILGNCSTVEEAKNTLSTLALVGVEDPVTQSVAPLHWMVVDSSGSCVVIEQTNHGLSMIENPLGVMTNSPEFNWHTTNLRNYMELDIAQSQSVQWDTTILNPFGQGGGSTLLPGGYTSPQRFVRTAFLKTHISKAQTQSEALTNCFHILENVSLPHGIVLASNNSYDYTKYTALMDIQRRQYYVKTYHNNQIHTALLSEFDDDEGEIVTVGPLATPMEDELFYYEAD